MPIVHESSQPSVARATFEKVLRVADLQPLIGAKGFSRFLINKPADDIYEYVWSHPDNVQRKKAMYGAETVPVEYCVKRLGIKDKSMFNLPQNICIKDGLILMRYLPEAKAVRDNFPLYSAMVNQGADMKAFNKNAEAREFDPATGRLISGRGEQATGHYKRKPNQSMQDITSEQEKGIANAFAQAEQFAKSTELDKSIPRDAEGIRMVTTGD